MWFAINTVLLAGVLTLVFYAARALPEDAPGFRAVQWGFIPMWVFLMAGYFDLNGSYSAYTIVSGLTVANLVAWVYCDRLRHGEWF